MDTILDIVKARLGRMDTEKDAYLKALIQATIEKLRGDGIHVQSTVSDDVFVADVVVWRYQNRDKPDGMPEWLKQERRERWLQDGGNQG
jgi:CRISPR/Cas system Type II protein with McrA/HNH and RuvC-like nuclease domain